MTYAPGSIVNAAAVWVDHGGANLGIVGDAAHTWGYHCGKDRIFGTGGQGWSDVSVQTTRDKAGLSNAASGLDLGHADKNTLRAFTKWLIDRCRAGDFPDLREVIGSLDGTNTVYYDRVRNVVAFNAAGVDSSHLWHTHLSFYRDSENRDKTGIFLAYWDESGGSMGVNIKLLGTVDATPLDAFGTARIGAKPITLWKVADASVITLPAGLDLGVVQLATALTALNSGYPAGTELVATNVSGALYVTAKAAVQFTPLPAAVVDCTAAIKAAVDPLSEQILALNASLEAALTRLKSVKDKAAAFASDIADE